MRAFGLQGDFLGVGLAALVVFLAAAVLVIYLYRVRKKKVVAFELAPSKFVQLNECRVHYIEQGKGPVLLLLHGIGASVFTWRKVFSALAKDYRVVALDLPGFGKSDKLPELDYGLDAQARRVIEFLNKLHIRQARLIGSSMGGAISLWLAKLEPERFPELVCLAPATNPKLAPPGVTNFHWSSPALEKLLTPVIMKEILKRVCSNKENHNPEIVDQYMAPFLRQPDAIRTFLKANKVLRDRRLPHELSSMTIPVLILWGEQDRMVARKFVQELQDTLPSSQLLITEGGHHLQEDQPHWVLEQVKNFFGSQDF